MARYTLTKYEKRLVDDKIITMANAGQVKEFSPHVFNLAVSIVLPQTRAEELCDGQKPRNIAYIDYVKDFYRIKYK